MAVLEAEINEQMGSACAAAAGAVAVPALQHEDGVALAKALLVLARIVAGRRQVAAQPCGGSPSSFSYVRHSNRRKWIGNQSSSGFLGAGRAPDHGGLRPDDAAVG